MNVSKLAIFFIQVKGLEDLVEVDVFKIDLPGVAVCGETWWFSTTIDASDVGRAAAAKAAAAARPTVWEALGYSTSRRT